MSSTSTEISMQQKKFIESTRVIIDMLKNRLSLNTKEQYMDYVDSEMTFIEYKKNLSGVKNKPDNYTIPKKLESLQDMSNEKIWRKHFKNDSDNNYAIFDGILDSDGNETLFIANFLSGGKQIIKDIKEKLNLKSDHKDIKKLLEDADNKEKHIIYLCDNCPDIEKLFQNSKYIEYHNSQKSFYNVTKYKFCPKSIIHIKKCLAKDFFSFFNTDGKKDPIIARNDPLTIYYQGLPGDMFILYRPDEFAYRVVSKVLRE